MKNENIFNILFKTNVYNCFIIRLLNNFISMSVDFYINKRDIRTKNSEKKQRLHKLKKFKK